MCGYSSKFRVWVGLVNEKDRCASLLFLLSFVRVGVFPTAVVFRVWLDIFRFVGRAQVAAVPVRRVSLFFHASRCMVVLRPALCPISPCVPSPSASVGILCFFVSAPFSLHIISGIIVMVVAAFNVYAIFKVCIEKTIRQKQNSSCVCHLLILGSDVFFVVVFVFFCFVVFCFVLSRPRPRRVRFPVVLRRSRLPAPPPPRKHCETKRTSVGIISFSLKFFLAYIAGALMLVNAVFNFYVIFQVRHTWDFFFFFFREVGVLLRNVGV